jgi:hypothetical protein
LDKSTSNAGILRLKLLDNFGLSIVSILTLPPTPNGNPIFFFFFSSDDDDGLFFFSSISIFDFSIEPSIFVSGFPIEGRIWIFLSSLKT